MSRWRHCWSCMVVLQRWNGKTDWKARIEANLASCTRPRWRHRESLHNSNPQVRQKTRVQGWNNVFQMQPQHSNYNGKTQLCCFMVRLPNYSRKCAWEICQRLADGRKESESIWLWLQPRRGHTWTLCRIRCRRSFQSFGWHCSLCNSLEHP